MVVLSWVMANWQALISLGTLILSVGVALAHLAHKEDTAQKLDDLSKIVSKLKQP